MRKYLHIKKYGLFSERVITIMASCNQHCPPEILPPRPYEACDAHAEIYAGKSQNKCDEERHGDAQSPSDDNSIIPLVGRPVEKIHETIYSATD